MMMLEQLRFRCGGCQASVKAPAHMAGRRARCGRCGRTIRIPGAGPTDPSDTIRPIPVWREGSSGSVRPVVPGGSGAEAADAAAGENDGDTPTRLVWPTGAPNRPPVPGSAIRRPENDPFLGMTIGSDFLIEEFVGSGGIATVYRARQLSLERTVALKILSGSLMNTRRADRFQREAVALANLLHPNVLQVFAFGEGRRRELGEDDRFHWMAVEFAEGGDTAGWLRNGPVPWGIAYQWLRQTLAGLQAAHDAGIIHRDLKPQNLMLTGQSAIRIADFGLIKLAGNSDTLTPDGKTVGTPAYIAPEQVVTHDVDARADIYGLGATFYHLFSGRTPFQGASAREMLEQHARGRPVRLEVVAPHVPLPLCRVIARMMEPACDLRYQTAAAVLGDLDGYDKFGGIRIRRPARS